MSAPKAAILNVKPIRVTAPLCVDLDGTLVCTDTLWECLIAAWRNTPLLMLLFPVWLLRGRAYLKYQAAKHADLDVRGLPYDGELVEWLRGQRDSGRTLLLVTGAAGRIAQDVANHLGLFSLVISSSPTLNLTGRRKLKALQEHFLGEEFEYIGDSSADMPIWAHSGKAHLRGASERLRAEVGSRNIAVLSEGRRGKKLSLKVIARQLRVHQWAKNLLVFIPILAGHRVGNWHLLYISVKAFAAFCFVASSFYVFNDLLDVRADRMHPTKRERPIASGQLGMTDAAIILVAALAVGLGLAVSVSFSFLLAILFYLAGTATYSLYAKRIVLVDAFTLAVLYTVRVVGGGVATHISLSSWTLGYTSFLFLSLALMKRYSEMSQRALDIKTDVVPGRGYAVGDLAIIGNIGVSSGMMSALLMALYLRSPEVEVLYKHPAYLMPLVIIHVYWISRAWLLTNRHQMHDDPIVFALKDNVTHRLLVLAAIIGYVATHGL